MLIRLSLLALFFGLTPACDASRRQTPSHAHWKAALAVGSGPAADTIGRSKSLVSQFDLAAAGVDPLDQTVTRVRPMQTEDNNRCEDTCLATIGLVKVNLLIEGNA